MLELRRGASVLGADCPSVTLVAARVTASAVDHWLDGKAHAWIETIDTALSIREMRNRRVEVELSPQSVTDVFTYDREASSMSFGDDRFSDRADPTPRLEGIDREIETIKGTLRHRSFIVGDFANEKGFTLITVPIIDDRGDVNIDNVTLFELVIIRDAVANDIIDARATTFGIVLISERRWFVPMIEGPLMNNLVNVTGRDPRLHHRAQVIHQLCVDSSRSSHRILMSFGQDQLLLLLQHHNQSLNISTE